MAPKKTIAERLRARLSPTRGNSKEGGDDEHGKLDPQLNRHGSTDFDKIFGTPSRKETSSAFGSASAASTHVT